MTTATLTAPTRFLTPKRAAAFVYLIVTVLEIMDASVVNVALPSLSRDFHVTPAHANGVVIFYLVGIAIAMPAAARLTEKFGDKPVFLWSCSAFLAASALCALAWSLPALCGMRLLQGLAGGVLTPVGTAMFLHRFPHEERTDANRVLMLPLVLAPALGPVIGGALVTNLSWRWIFLINLPIGIVAMRVSFRRLDRVRDSRRLPFDGRALLLAAVGLGTFMFALSEGPSRGYGSPEVWLPLVVGASLLILFVRWQWRVPRPVLDLRLLKQRVFGGSVASIVLGFTGYAGLFFVLPVTLQEGRGLSALTSGLLTLPEALSMAVFTQVVARLMRRIDARVLIASGLLFVGLSLIALGFAATTPSIPIWVIGLIMAIDGAAFAFALLPSQVLTYADIERESNAQAATLMSVTSQVGGAIGVAALSMLVNLSGTAPLSSYRPAFFVGAAILIAGIAPLAVIPRRVT